MVTIAELVAQLDGSDLAQVAEARQALRDLVHAASDPAKADRAGRPGLAAGLRAGGDRRAGRPGADECSRFGHAGAGPQAFGRGTPLCLPVLDVDRRRPADSDSDRAVRRSGNSRFGPLRARNDRNAAGDDGADQRLARGEPRVSHRHSECLGPAGLGRRRGRAGPGHPRSRRGGAFGGARGLGQFSRGESRQTLRGRHARRHAPPAGPRQKARMRLAETLHLAGENELAEAIYAAIAADAADGPWKRAAHPPVR